ncbi:hypothetical protein QAD02_018327 [Eretmocerus hayati]|uniref:Uncharacterized protein n=1 Tax=Eretmocerus hayati TaxID=131215 RepID=A0ACC2PGJ0_9HYME|nr:hypothetical protein QAD02_018327 [Eretmocerus hayati]
MQNSAVTSSAKSKKRQTSLSKDEAKRRKLNSMENEGALSHSPEYRSNPLPCSENEATGMEVMDIVGENFELDHSGFPPEFDIMVESALFKAQMDLINNYRNGNDDHSFDIQEEIVDDDPEDVQTDCGADDCEVGSEEDDADELDPLIESIKNLKSEVRLYGNSRVTLERALFLVATLYVKCKLPKENMNHILYVFHELLPENNLLPRSSYLFFKEVKSYAPDFSQPVRYFYCKNCKAGLGTNHPQMPCDFCSSEQGFGCFYCFNLAEQIRFLFEHRNLGEIIEASTDTHSEFICDIKDSSEYIRASKTFLNRTKYDLVLIMGADEVPQHLRESFIIVNSVWCDYQKPKMNTYLEPICRQLKECFDEGISWTCPETGEKRITRVIAPLWSLDAQARAEVGNFLGHGGSFGCNTCEIETVQCQPVKGKKLKRIYVSPEVEPRLRDDARMRAQAARAHEKFKSAYFKLIQRQVIHVRGIKGFSILCILPSLKLHTCFIPEFLHAVLLGPVRDFLRRHFSSNLKGNLKRHMADINALWKKIRPPNTFSRLPKNLEQWHEMKGHELLHWLLIYSIPILKKYLAPEYLQHWIAFVIGTFNLLKTKIGPSDTAQSELLFKIFVRDIKNLYDDRMLTYNMHQLLHLVLYVIRWGPMWATSAFGFESFNSFLSRCLHGKKDVAKELVNTIQIYNGKKNLRNGDNNSGLQRSLNIGDL